MFKTDVDVVNIEKFVISEQRGSGGKKNTYTSHQNSIVTKDEQNYTFTQSFSEHIIQAFKEVFLPFGYPDTVSEDYLSYQLWDTLQAFCSTITGIFATQAILEGVGVGDTTAKPLSAAITWVIKDGTGMIGRILFTWWKGTSLDTNCKSWRLFADILNDVAMFLELFLPYVQIIRTYILCLTSSMKAIVGVTGGATRASITQHQAIRGNMADVCAKDGSQETCVNLLASIFGIFLLTTFEGNDLLQWFLFFLFTTIHIIANYCAVKSLVFNDLNTTRCLYVLKTYMMFDTVPNPKVVNDKEPLFFKTTFNVQVLCGFNIYIGGSLKYILQKCNSKFIEDLIDAFASREYIIIPDLENRVLHVALSARHKSRDVITAYFHAAFLGMALSYYNHFPLDFNVKRHVRHVTPLQRLVDLLKKFDWESENELKIFSLEDFVKFNEFINMEITNFFTALVINGWNINKHSLPLNEWICFREKVIKAKED